MPITEILVLSSSSLLLIRFDYLNNLLENGHFIVLAAFSLSILVSHLCYRDWHVIFANFYCFTVYGYHISYLLVKYELFATIEFIFFFLVKNYY